MDGPHPPTSQPGLPNPLAALAGVAAAAGDALRRLAGHGPGRPSPPPAALDTWPGGRDAPAGTRRHARAAGKTTAAVDWVTDRRAAGGGGPPGTAPPLPPPSHEAAKADLGRATWTLLHTLAAQYPDRPNRRQREDVGKLIDVLTRVYPCGECASHFAGFVKARPPRLGSGPDLRGWVCEVHNDVNASLGKPPFNCALVGSRWAPLDCEGEGGEVGGACALK